MSEDILKSLKHKSKHSITTPVVIKLFLKVIYYTKSTDCNLLSAVIFPSVFVCARYFSSPVSLLSLRYYTLC